MKRTLQTRHRTTAILMFVATCMCLALAMMGRVWWCEAGDASLWSWDIWSPHNSQHLVDPYSLSHIEHGICFFLALMLVNAESLSTSARIVIVACLEAGWEILENTPLIINRYREATISLDYYGDSILNSLGDYIMCLLGAVLVCRTSWKTGLWAFVALEVVSILWIRDSLILNIIMLTAPVEAIRQWQSPI